MHELIENAILLRITVGESDRCGHHPLYEAIVLKAREVGLAGATVYRGVMGFGASHHLHTAKMLELASDLPFLIEIVDETSKVQAFLPILEAMAKHSLITQQNVSARLPKAS